MRTRRRNASSATERANRKRTERTGVPLGGEREKRVSHTHKRLHAYIKTNPKKSIKTTRDGRVVFCFFPSSSTLSSFNSVVRIFSQTTRTTFPLRQRQQRYYKTTRRGHAKEVCALLLCVFLFCFDKSFSWIRDACTRSRDICGPDKALNVRASPHAVT